MEFARIKRQARPITMAEWNKLTSAEQSVVQRGAQLAAGIVRQMATVRDGESLAAVKKLGMKVNEIDVGPLQKAALTAQDDLAKEFGAEALLAQIRKQ